MRRTGTYSLGLENEGNHGTMVLGGTYYQRFAESQRQWGRRAYKDWLEGDGSELDDFLSAAGTYIATDKQRFDAVTVSQRHSKDLFRLDGVREAAREAGRPDHAERFEEQRRELYEAIWKRDGA